MKKTEKGKGRLVLEALGEGLLEILLFGIFTGIGGLAWWLFGGTLEDAWLDGEWLFLLGILLVTVATFLVCGVVSLIKKCRKRRRGNQEISLPGDNMQETQEIQEIRETQETEGEKE